MNRKTLRQLAVLTLAAASVPAFAQAVAPEPRNVIALSASGNVEVAQDLLRLSMSTARDGSDAGVVQTQLRQALDQAVAEAKKTAQPGQMDVRTGGFSLNPRYSRDGKINGWQGSAELVLEGRDFPRITSAAARINTMTIADVGFSLSREARASAERQAQAQAIEQFRAKAAEVVHAFGLADYSLREVSVQAADRGATPMMMGRAKAQFASAEAAPVPVEPGQSTVTVTVSGTVQAR